MIRPASHRVVLVALVAALLVGACAGGDEEVSGTVRVTGSTTLLPMISEVAGRFAAAHPLVETDVRMTGTGDGLALFCDGVVPVVGASRGMSARERETCAESGVQYLQLQVALDAVVLVTAAEMTAPACLSEEQIYALLGPQSSPVRRWSEAGSVIAGAGRDLPDAAFTAIGPAAASGTRALLIDLAIARIAVERGERADLRPDAIAEVREQEIVNGIAGARTVLGFSGLATAAQWGERVRRLAVDFGDGCIAPQEEAVRDGDYPMSRPLYVYVDVARAREDAALRGFVAMLLSPEGLAAAANAGGVLLGEDEAQAQRAAWRRALEPGGGA